MKTETELNEDILKLTTTITEKYPELAKNMEEMPVTVPDNTNAEITNKNLRDYYDSLNSLLKKYIIEHQNMAHQ